MPALWQDCDALGRVRPAATRADQFNDDVSALFAQEQRARLAAGHETRARSVDR